MYDLDAAATVQSRGYRAEGLDRPPALETTQAKMERWEQCLRTQISRHPRIMLATGLALGILAGVWAKR